MDAPEKSSVARAEPSNDVVAPPADSPVARAIAAMRADPTTSWTVDSLARKAGASRATLARRFVAETGVSPLKYLTRLRMERAAELLRTTDDPLAAVAPAVGYETEFALSRAFRRHFGVAPGRFRKQSGAGVTRTVMAA